MSGAYNEVYLYDAMRNLGEMMDYAVNELEEDADGFLNMFINSGIAAEIERANPKYITGMSGIELAQTVLDRAGQSVSTVISEVSGGASFDYYNAEPSGLSNVYWMGWILAYYQWHSAMNFGEILKYTNSKELLRMYNSLHEASEDVFVNRMNERIRSLNLPARLQARRKDCGYSQSGLAKRSGVSVRAIQEYESKARNINKASGETLLALARTLGCRVEDIMEFNLEYVV